AGHNNRAARRGRRGGKAAGTVGPSLWAWQVKSSRASSRLAAQILNGRDSASFQRWAGMLFSAPVGGENGVDVFLLPFALEQAVLAEMRFAAHAETLHQAERGRVARIATGIDAVEIHAAETQADDGPHRLCGVAMALMIGVEDIADLALPVGGGAPDQCHLAEKMPLLAVFDGEGDAIVDLCEGHLADAGLHRLGAAFAGHRPIEEVARDI